MQRIGEFNLEHAQDVVRRSEETAGFRLCIANADRELPALVNDAVITAIALFGSATAYDRIEPSA